MPLRDIIKIDREKCNGCGQCVSACAEGAIQMIDGRAALVREDYCDGLGACLGECPTGALTIEKREAPEFTDPNEGHDGNAHAKPSGPAPAPVEEKPKTLACGCPGTMEHTFERGGADPSPTSGCPGGGCGGAAAESELTHWPVQLHLANPSAKAFKLSHLLIAADCTAFALGSFHKDLLKMRSLVIACPKLDDTSPYFGKLAEIITVGEPRSLTVARMEVPCCRGLTALAIKARELAASNLPITEIVISTNGKIIGETQL